MEQGVPAPRAWPWKQRSPTAREAILEILAIQQEEQEAKRNLTGDFSKFGESLMKL